ncbi:PglZ domain-containing protein [Desulfonatronum zhilinae]|nr:PglZ domain-containing protein [Desulfonatronum zhilinae]
MAKLSDRIRGMIARQVRERGIVVWYDPDQAYAGLVRNLELPDTVILQYVDSFFRLRRELEPHLEFVGPDGRPMDGCGVPPNVVVYVPLARESTSFALVEAETAGIVVEPGAESLERNSRLRVQAETFFLEVAPEKAAHLARQVEEGLLTLEDLDRISEEVNSIASGALKLIFGAASPIESIILFASGPSRDADIMAKRALGELRNLIISELGLDFGETSIPDEARQKLRRIILLAEFASAVPVVDRPQALAAMELPQNPVQQDALRHLCETWRNRVDLRDGYVQAARDVEDALGLGRLSLDPAHLANLETFPGIETPLLRSAQSALLQGRISEALGLAETRGRSFWSREAPEVFFKWAALSLACQVLSKAAGIREQIKSRDFTAAEMVRAYALFSEPWMMVDRLHRHWESRLLNLDPETLEEDDFEKVTVMVRRVYADLVDEMNRSFVHHFHEAGFVVQGVLAQQRIFSERVAPLLSGKQKTAYLLVDALRHEMADELLDGMDKDFETSLEPAIGALPSTTPVGMSALLPGAEHGLQVTLAKGRLSVLVEGRAVGDRRNRLAWLDEQVSGKVEALRLADVLRIGAKRKKELKAADLIVVTSQEIDFLGEEGEGHLETRRWMDDILEQLRRSIRILARLGVERFILAADHGHLFTDRFDPGMFMDSPGGNVTELHPRVWIGKGGTDAEGSLRVPAGALGYPGDLEFAFPRGLACYRVKGGVGGYFHGGISLQELVIPVASLRPRATTTTGSSAVKVSLSIGKSVITNRFFSMVATLGVHGFLAPDEVRVRAVVLSGDREVGFCAMAAQGYEEGTREIVLRPDAPNALTFMLAEDKGVETVIVRILDCQTQLVLACMSDIPVKLGM